MHYPDDRHCCNLPSYPARQQHIQSYAEDKLRDSVFLTETTTPCQISQPWWGRIHRTWCDSCPILEDWLYRTLTTQLSPYSPQPFLELSVVPHYWHFFKLQHCYSSLISQLWPQSCSPWNRLVSYFQFFQTTCNLTVQYFSIIRATQKME